MTVSVKLERDLRWDGCFNVRDLGGFRTGDGGRTRWGALVRADGLNRLTASGWSALEAHGVRTVVDLRNDDELDPDAAPRPPSVTTVRVPIDDIGDRGFWEEVWANELDGSPLYYRMFLERKPHQCASALAAVAQAPRGGVVFHCGRGRDRTGLVSLLLLGLVGVGVDDVASDYELSTARVRLLDAALGEHDQGDEIAAILERNNTSTSALIEDLLGSFDLAALLRKGGLHDDDVDALRKRFVDPP